MKRYKHHFLVPLNWYRVLVNVAELKNMSIDDTILDALEYYYEKDFEDFFFITEENEEFKKERKLDFKVSKELSDYLLFFNMHIIKKEIDIKTWIISILFNLYIKYKE